MSVSSDGGLVMGDVSEDGVHSNEELPTSLNGSLEHQSEGGADDEVKEDLLEPRLKYELLHERDIKELFAKTTASCIAVHDKLMAIGTQSGQIYVMDHMGHVDHCNVPVYKPHRCAVTRLDIDTSGFYIMSAAQDGKVVVYGLNTRELNHTFNLRTPARSIAFCPDYSRKDSAQRCLIGERNLVMYERGVLKSKETILFRGAEKDGFITALTWKGQFIAYTNEQGTRIYDKLQERTVTSVGPTHDVDRLRSTRFPPSHCWLDSRTLAIGWADTVVIVKIVDGIQESTKKETRWGEIHYSWKLNMSVSGLSHIMPTETRFDDDMENSVPTEPWGEIVVFGLKPGEEAENGVDAFCDIASVASLSTAALSGPTPLVQVEILEPESSNSYCLQAEDKISFTAQPFSLPGQFHLRGLPEYNLYFLLGPKELVSASPNCADDVVRWRRDNNRLEEAWSYAMQHADEINDKECFPQHIGRLMIEDLIRDGRGKYAAKRLAEVCGENKSEWEYFVNAFEKTGLILLLADVLPQQRPQLEPECYEEVLHGALYNDLRLFRRLVQRWNPDLYRVGALTGLTLQRVHTSTPAESTISQDEEIDLLLALANLYVSDRKYEFALNIYFSLKDKCIFTVIRKHQLFELVKDQITELMTIDKDQALNLLLNNEMAVPPAEVMTKIAREPKLQLAYLKKLFERNEGEEYSDQAVALFATYDRPQLLPFLRKNRSYHTNKALEICSQKNYTEERVFLLVKSGNRKEALNLMIQQQDRLDKAIDLCKEYEDDELWEMLMAEVIQSRSAHQVAQLLGSAGACIEPLRIIEKIPGDLEIPNLRDLLVKILRDYEAQVLLQMCCQSATLDDVTEMFNTFTRQSSTAVYFGPRTVCVLCSSVILSSGDRREELRVFGCSHGAHARCCVEFERRRNITHVSCPVCADDSDSLSET